MEAADFPPFILYSLFLSPKSVSAVRMYGDETDIRRFCAFLSIPSGMLKKCRPKKWKGKRADGIKQCALVCCKSLFLQIKNQGRKSEDFLPYIFVAFLEV